VRGTAQVERHYSVCKVPPNVSICAFSPYFLFTLRRIAPQHGNVGFPSTAPLRPTYSHVSPVLPTWHPDDGCGLLPLIAWKFRPFVSLQSASGRFQFWCHRLERPASPRRICAVTRGFQTTTQYLSVLPFLPRHYHMCYYYYSLLLSAPVVLVISNIISAALKCLWWCWWLFLFRHRWLWLLYHGSCRTQFGRTASSVCVPATWNSLSVARYPHDRLVPLIPKITQSAFISGSL